jgi:putative membrane protein
MYSARTWAFAVILSSAGTSTLAQGTTTLGDSQISQVAHTAMQIEIDNANLALNKSQSASVRAFARATRKDYSSADEGALSSHARFHFNLQDNPVSQSLADSGSEQTQKLSKLSGDAFDKAYARNELAHHILITGALEATLIPAARDARIKTLLKNELALFQERLKEAKQLADQFQAHTQPTPAPPRRDYE